MLGRVVWEQSPGRTELDLERLGGLTLARATVHVPEGQGRLPAADGAEAGKTVF